MSLCVQIHMYICMYFVFIHLYKYIFCFVHWLSYIRENIYLSFLDWFTLAFSWDHFAANCKSSFFFYGWVLFPRVNVPWFLYPFLCWFDDHWVDFLSSLLWTGLLWIKGCRSFSPMQISFHLDMSSGVGWLGCMADQFSVVWELSILTSTVVVLAYTATDSEVPFSSSLSTGIVSRVLN